MTKKQLELAADAVLRAPRPRGQIDKRTGIPMDKETLAVVDAMAECSCQSRAAVVRAAIGYWLQEAKNEAIRWR